VLPMAVVGRIEPALYPGPCAWPVELRHEPQRARTNAVAAQPGVDLHLGDQAVVHNLTADNVPWHILRQKAFGTQTLYVNPRAAIDANRVLCWALARLRAAQAPPLQVFREPQSQVARHSRDCSPSKSGSAL